MAFDPRDVFLAHIAATRTINKDTTLTAVVWPENVINITGNGVFTNSRELTEIAVESRRLGVPFVVGITEAQPLHPVGSRGTQRVASR